MSATVCVSYDFDAVSAWLANDMPGYAEWGEFGATTATPRLLDLHDTLDIPATWFIPGHTIESFPEICGDIWDRSYDIQHHSWAHEALPSFESKDAERADFERAIDNIVELTGREPTGFRNPTGGFSEHTVELLREFDFEWDSSGKVTEFQPYYLRTDQHVERGELYDPGVETDIVELPLIWHRDDWLQLFPIASDPHYVSFGFEEEVFQRWRTEIDWMLEHVGDGVYVMLLHPQCSGRAPFLSHLEGFFTDLQARPGVEFAEMDTVAREFAE
ncbi:MAG: polysaccharide deacetylase family protein [Halobacteriales archaeon]